MGAFDFIKGMFGGPKEPVDQLAVLGANPNRTSEYIELLARSNVWLIGNASEVATTNANEGEVLKKMDEAAKQLSVIESSAEVKFHTFELDKHTVLPFFTSEPFIGKYVENAKFKKVTTLQGFALSASILLRDDLIRIPAIMNPHSSLTRYLSAEDKVALAKLISG
ncbi:MAG TPA: SseB family protein [Verrucomicrobiae bacterium]|jgi:hypothetical protein